MPPPSSTLLLLTSPQVPLPQTPHSPEVQSTSLEMAEEEDDAPVAVVLPF
jgi:hypothetical protein